MNLNLKNNKVVNAWCMYDWSNSVYNLVITSTIFPVYYSSVTRNFFGGEKVQFLGLEITNTVLYSYSISFSFLAIALFSPLLSGIADYGGMKKLFLRIFTYIGAAACITLYFFDGSNIELGIFASIVASIGYSGSLVFYNAFLPEITTSDRYDIVSAKGYAMGYAGSLLLLLFNLISITFPDWFGFANGGEASRFAFLLVGVWWLGFSLIPFHFLPTNPYNRKPAGKLLAHGYKEVRKVFRSLRELPSMRRYLKAFFFYNMGVQTVMFLAATFGDKELKLPGEKLILTVLIIQVVAVAGSYLFAYVSKIKGNKISLSIMVVIWILVCLGAYFVTSAMQFYVVATVVGLVMGGIQSQSRSAFSKLIPENTIDHASYFSFYDVTEKLSIVIGTFAYGLIEQLTGSMRNSTLALATFFILGLFFLRQTNFKIIRLPKAEEAK
ncbi:MAG: MFS transporter [Imperialibacter sp.]|uniref:MFS transporter n=1 Tax=Imperialibacter sp. TaxID=2038411 RepID=UPI0032EB54A5